MSKKLASGGQQLRQEWCIVNAYELLYTADFDLLSPCQLLMQSQEDYQTHYVVDELTMIKTPTNH